MKLNVGCDANHLPDYINIDIRKEVKPDLIADVTKGLNFKDNSIELIRLEHFLEHLFYIQVEPFLKECYRVLKMEGEIVIEVPDIIKVCKLLIERKKPAKECLKAIYGGYADSDMNIPQLHKWGWTGETLRKILEKIGFEIVKIGPGELHFPERDTFIRAKKRKIRD